MRTSRGVRLVALLAAMSGAACHGGGASAPDAGDDSGAVSLADASSPAVVAAGTTGRTCSTSADCLPDGSTLDSRGPNVCSNQMTETVDGVDAQLWPTPVCVPKWPSVANQGNCDPAPPATDPDGLDVHFCDVPPGADPGASPFGPGVCVPFDPSNPQTGLGICYPVCTFELDGGPAAGCQGKDSCVFLSYRPYHGSVLGFGYCQGTCQTEADCAGLNGDAGLTYHCQTDTGFCTLQASIVRTKSLGDTCTVADSESGACNCFAGPSGNGYCSSRCIVGGTPCPSGWVCDTGQPSAYNPLGTNGVYRVSGPTVGMVGNCAPVCSPIFDGGAAADASAADATSPLGDAGTADAGPAGDGGEDSSGDATFDAPFDGTTFDGTTFDGTTFDGTTGDSAPGDSGSDAGADAALAPDGAAEDSGMSTAHSPVTPGQCPPASICVSGGAVGTDCLP